MFAQDCNFPIDWRCGCEKCETGTTMEISFFKHAVRQDRDQELPSVESTHMTDAIYTVSLHRSTMGVDEILPRTYYHGEEL